MGDLYVKHTIALPHTVTWVYHNKLYAHSNIASLLISQNTPTCMDSKQHNRPHLCTCTTEVITTDLMELCGTFDAVDLRLTLQIIE